MKRLLYAITFTPDIETMKRYYRDAVGLPIDHDTPYWVSFRTGTTGFSLMAVHPGVKREIELCFETRDIETDVAALRARGLAFADSITEQAFGRIIHARDPDGTLVTLLEPTGEAGTAPRAVAGTPMLHHAIVNCLDLPAARHFYRERWGLHAGTDSEWWVEFEVGGAGLALHPRVEGGPEQHHAQPVTLAFSVDDLPTWADAARTRGMQFVAAPMDEGHGLMADVMDPDGNVIILREPPEAPSIEEELAAAYEDDDVPHLAAIRKPVQKSSKAVSRVVHRPEYKEKSTKPQPKQATEAKRAAVARSATQRKARVASPRGTGPAGSRAKPKRLSDPKRARNRPAVGRLKKAERRSMARKKTAVARASKSRPVKHAATGRAASKRATSKRAASSRAASSRAASRRSVTKRVAPKRAAPKRTVSRRPAGKGGRR